MTLTRQRHCRRVSRINTKGMTMGKFDNDHEDPIGAVRGFVIGSLILLAFAAVLGCGFMLVDLYLVPGE
jgi:hypothetical protein